MWQNKILLVFYFSAIGQISGVDGRGAGRDSDAVGTVDKEIAFISDTQQPLAVEKILHRPNHNIKATSLLLADVLKRKPVALYMLGDVVGIGSSDRKWVTMDRFFDSCRTMNIAFHALLGNHDLMWTRRKGEANFQRRFADHVNTGYASIVDSVGIVLLNSNFKKLTAAETEQQQRWYDGKLQEMDSDPAIRVIIVSCHHSPFSNSRVVGSSAPVQRWFLPGFMKTAKCRVFITGHAHAFEHFKHEGKDFLVIGGGGGLHQRLDTSLKRIPDVAFDYKPMFHYLTMRRKGDQLLFSSRFLKADFSGVEEGYSFETGAGDR